MLSLWHPGNENQGARTTVPNNDRIFSLQVYIVSPLRCMENWPLESIYPVKLGDLGLYELPHRRKQQRTLLKVLFPRP